MARYSVAVRSAGAGSTTLPVGSLYAAAAASGALREVGAFNTTSTSVAIKLARLTTAGTAGAGLTEGKYDPDRVAPSCTAFDTHTIAPTVADVMKQAVLGAAVGSGVIWTFGDTGIRIPVGTANGVGIVVSTGTGQVLDWYMDWDE